MARPCCLLACLAENKGVAQPPFENHIVSDWQVTVGTVFPTLRTRHPAMKSAVLGPYSIHKHIHRAVGQSTFGRAMPAMRRIAPSYGRPA